ncbi:MAG: hypothetical protein DRP47_00425 [Candidatus Zixiibacteriota bacterium]|nr:MAG: hypothetical protein DRP47_00425 [candidate division Zixibacteria bacterium]
MKINPIGIQSYQQLNNQRKNIPSQAEKAGMPERSLTISPKEITARSEVAIKAPEGSYADFLSTEEKSALDMLFRRYADSDRFGPSFNRDVDSGNREDSLGRVIDLKV